MKISHQSGMFEDTIPNMMKTLRLLDGSTTSQTATKLFTGRQNIAARIRRLNKLACGKTIVWKKTGTQGGTWAITELGRQVLVDNEVDGL